MNGLLLDTCAVLWAFGSGEISAEAGTAIESAARENRLFISPITAWEIGILTRKSRIALTLAPEQWFDEVLATPGLRLANMGPKTLIASSFLPGEPPGDPADRIIAATARAEKLTLVTRDARLLDYGRAGHLGSLAC